MEIDFFALCYWLVVVFMLLWVTVEILNLDLSLTLLLEAEVSWLVNCCRVDFRSVWVWSLTGVEPFSVFEIWLQSSDRFIWLFFIRTELLIL